MPTTTSSSKARRADRFVLKLDHVWLAVALIGAIVIAYEERSARRRVLTLAEEVALRQPPRGEPLPSAPVAAITPEAPNS